jgi:hypothetical protein
VGSHKGSAIQRSFSASGSDLLLLQGSNKPVLDA